jgi:amino acid transporter
MGYSFVGMIVSAVVVSIAELSALVPLSGGIIRHAEYFVDPALSFANGWNLIYGQMVSLPAELVAAAVIVEFWITINPGIWIVVFGALLIISNVFFVRIYGELEFTFATLKIMLIVGLNIMALVITCGGGPDHQTYGFRYWRNPGPFVAYLEFTGVSLKGTLLTCGIPILTEFCRPRDTSCMHTFRLINKYFLTDI